MGAVTVLYRRIIHTDTVLDVQAFGSSADQ